jgi:hypothetical protein
VDTLGLKSGSGIWTLFLAIQAVAVPIAGIHALGDDGMITVLLLM